MPKSTGTTDPHPTPDNVRRLTKKAALRPEDDEIRAERVDNVVSGLRRNAEALARVETVQREHSKAIERVERAILVEVIPQQSEVARILGKPGDPEAASRLSISDMTPAEAERAMRAAALGTGLCRAVAEVHIRDAQRDRRMVKDAARGASVRTIGATIGAGLLAAFASDPVGTVAFVRGLFGG